MEKVLGAKELGYIHSELIKENNLMKKIAKKLEEDQKSIQLAPYEGALLSFLVRLSRAQQVVEIGTLYGYSSTWILEGLAPEGKLTTVEFSKDNYEQARSFLSEHARASDVEVRNQSGLEFFEGFEGYIDLLFIDADKGNYLNYLKAALPFLKPGSLVLGDNSFLFGLATQDSPPEKYSKNTWEKMREFNKILTGSTGEFKGVMVPTLEGLTVGMKV